MQTWVVALLGIAVTLLGIGVTISAYVLGFAIAQDRRITRLEERVQGLGGQMLKIPKRKTDEPVS